MIHDTQQGAWNDLQDTLGAKQAAVLAELERGPATLFELTRRLGMPVNRISGRITELSARGLIQDTGIRRINPESGKGGIVWRVTGK